MSKLVVSSCRVCAENVLRCLIFPPVTNVFTLRFADLGVSVANKVWLLVQGWHKLETTYYHCVCDKFSRVFAA